MATDDIDHQVGEALAGVTDHLDRIALAGEFDFRGLDFGRCGGIVGLGIGHGIGGLVARNADAPGRGVARRSMDQLNKP
ncbi:hypothetical protein D3C78_1815720 [compost metagenome]